MIETVHRGIAFSEKTGLAGKGALSGNASRSRSQRERAFTLIEIMVVIALLALVTAGSTMAFGALTRTKLRSGCMRIVSAARFAYSRAVSRGTTVRLVLDLDEHKMSLEEAQGEVTLARSDEDRNEEDSETGAGVDPWAAAKARLEETFEPSYGRSPFSPMRGINGNVLKKYTPSAIADGVRLTRVYTPHEEEPREQGSTAIYFFPGGFTQHAAVQLTDPRGTIYTVELDALTGRGTVHTEEYEPEQLFDEDEDEGLRDPG